MVMEQHISTRPISFSAALNCATLPKILSPHAGNTEIWDIFSGLRFSKSSAAAAPSSMAPAYK